MVCKADRNGCGNCSAFSLVEMSCHWNHAAQPLYGRIIQAVRKQLNAKTQNLEELCHFCFSKPNNSSSFYQFTDIQTKNLASSIWDGAYIILGVWENIGKYSSARKLRVKTISDKFPIDPFPRSLIQTTADRLITLKDNLIDSKN